MPSREFTKNAREIVRVTPTVYEGHELIDIRVYVNNRSTGELGPTRKGIALNVDLVPELIDALTWALGQPCNSQFESDERRLTSDEADQLAAAAWRTLHDHGTAVHWDSAEKLVLSKLKGFSKWDLHYVLSTRKDLFERIGQTFRARNEP
jgi:hypothetical protein